MTTKIFIMIFPTLPTSLLGFAALTIAAPHLHSRFENEAAVREAEIVARGLQWTPRELYPRKGNNDNNNVVTDITITEEVDTVVSSSSRNSDIELVQILQEEVIVVDNSKQFRDNVRKNTFKNKNENVNTVVIIVTEVIDSRDPSNKKTRYLTRQVESNKDIQEQVLIVISESNQYTVTSDDSKKLGPTATGSSSAASTGSAQQFGTYDPNAAAVVSGDNSASLLPEGASAPKWSNAQDSADPAEILLETPSDAVFVEFVDEDSSSTDVAIVVDVSSS